MKKFKLAMLIAASSALISGCGVDKGESEQSKVPAVNSADNTATGTDLPENAGDSSTFPDKVLWGRYTPSHQLFL